MFDVSEFLGLARGLPPKADPPPAEKSTASRFIDHAADVSRRCSTLVGYRM